MAQPVNVEPAVVVLAPGVMVRPMAEGTLAIVSDQPPLVLDALRERIIAICARPTERSELVDVLVELSGLDHSTVADAVDELVGRGLLRST